MPAKTTLTILFLIGLQTIAHAQDRDSLQAAKYNEQSRKVYLNNPDSSIIFANQALKISLKSNIRFEEGLANYYLSKSNWVKSNYLLSTQYGFNALKIFENSRYTEEWAVSLVDLARNFIDMKDFNRATEFLDKAFQLGKAGSGVSLANAAREKSMLFFQTGQYDSSLHYTNIGLPIFKSQGDSLNVSILYGRKARILLVKGDAAGSMNYNNAALKLDIMVGNKRGMSFAYLMKAEFAANTNQFDSALYFINQSTKLAKELNNLGAMIRAETLLVEIYKKKNDIKAAFSHLVKLDEIKGEMYDSEKNGQIQELLTIYELGSKEHTIKLLEKENALKQAQVKNQKLFLTVLITGIVLLVGIIFVLWILRRIQNKANQELERKNKEIDQQNKEIESQAEVLKQMNDVKSKIFSVISHDLRGPFSSLLGMLDLLNDKKISNDEFISMSKKLKTHLDINKQTMQNLLSWSQNQLGGLSTQPVKIDVSLLVQDVFNSMKGTAEQKQIKLECVRIDDISIFADVDQLKLILRNLTHNAIKFSSPGSLVVIRNQKINNNGKIIVEDSGVGMSQEEIEIILNHKGNFSKQGTQHEKGTGLGLMLVREFVAKNGGEFEIESRENEGSKISIIFPLA